MVFSYEKQCKRLVGISTADHALEIYSCKLNLSFTGSIVGLFKLMLVHVSFMFNLSLPFIWFGVVVSGKDCLSLILSSRRQNTCYTAVSTGVWFLFIVTTCILISGMKISLNYLNAETYSWTKSNIIIYSKYFSFSDWLKSRAQFIITSYCWPNLENFCHIEPMTSRVQQSCRFLNH